MERDLFTNIKTKTVSYSTMYSQTQQNTKVVQYLQLILCELKQVNLLYLRILVKQFHLPINYKFHLT